MKKNQNEICPKITNRINIDIHSECIWFSCSVCLLPIKYKYESSSSYIDT